MILGEDSILPDIVIEVSSYCIINSVYCYWPIYIMHFRAKTIQLVSKFWGVGGGGLWLEGGNPRYPPPPLYETLVCVYVKYCIGNTKFLPTNTCCGDHCVIPSVGVGVAWL